MTVYGGLFYLLAALVLGTTALAVTRRHPVHAVVYLILSFLGTALLFYLLGAPFLAALEVIIYAGAIMVLFLFVVMMIRTEAAMELRRSWRQWLPAFLLSLAYLAAALLLATADHRSRVPLALARSTPRSFGRFVFENYGLAVEVLSLLLLIGLVAAIQLGRRGEDSLEEGKR